MTPTLCHSDHSANLLSPLLPPTNIMHTNEGRKKWSCKESTCGEGAVSSAILLNERSPPVIRCSIALTQTPAFHKQNKHKNVNNEASVPTSNMLMISIAQRHIQAIYAARISSTELVRNTIQTRYTDTIITRTLIKIQKRTFHNFHYLRDIKTHTQNSLPSGGIRLPHLTTIAFKWHFISYY